MGEIKLPFENENDLLKRIYGTDFVDDDIVSINRRTFSLVNAIGVRSFR